jgi:hypothetical protein
MTKLFRTKSADTVRSVRYPILLTQAEAESIRASANSAKKSVADFMRGAALGRAPKQDFRTEAVLALIGLTREIRELHKAMNTHGKPVCEDNLADLIVRAGSVMLRIEG